MTTTEQIAAEALAGPWRAVIVDMLGRPIDTWQLNPANVRIVIVRRSAIPQSSVHRMPIDFDPSDAPAEWDEFLDVIGVRRCWVQAQAMVAGLNAAAEALTAKAVAR